MSKTDTTDVGPVGEQGAPLAVVSPLMAQLGIQISDPDVVALRIAQGLAEATTLDSLLGGSEAVSWRERPEVPYRIKGVEWAESDMGEGIGFFAIVTAVNLNTSQTEILTTGATNVVIQLAKIMQEGWQDQAVEYLEATTAKGFKVGRLSKAEDPSSPF